MIRIHQDNIVPAYPNGSWSWNQQNEKITYNPWDSDVFLPEFEVKSSSGYQFKSTINQMEEVIFRQEFTRPDTTHDSDVIVIQDIKNLVLFLAPSEIMNSKIVSFLHTKAVDWFLNALITYFEYFLRLVEFILIRRDDVSGKMAQLESTESTDIKRVYSEYLSQYRLILAREYSAILVGNGEMKPFYHITPVTNISKTLKDKVFHESFLAICTQIVWIAHHRRAYDVIDSEINRLFRSDHFKLNRRDAIEFNQVEREVLFGKNNRFVNCRYQNSPLIQELAKIRPHNLPILWIGYKKYRGTNPRIQQLEMEIIIPDSELILADISHGILGHPKKLYDTLLTLNWHKVRDGAFSKHYDPYRLLEQPNLEIPKLDALKHTYEKYDSYFSLKDSRYEYTPELIKKWKRRDKVIEYMKTEGLLVDVFSKCRDEIRQMKNPASTWISSLKVITNFLAYKQKQLKK